MDAQDPVGALSAWRDVVAFFFDPAEAHGPSLVVDGMRLLLPKLRGRSVALAASTLVLSCASPPAPAPSAVITASPAAVCLGDGFSTPIALDATKSASRLTLVYAGKEPGEPPLSFSWSFSGSDRRIDDGTSTSEQLIVRVAGDRPLHVRLRVTNAAGGVTEALTTIAITATDESGRCPLAE